MAVVSLLPLKFFSSSADNIARKNREVRKKWWTSVCHKKIIKGKGGR